LLVIFQPSDPEPDALLSVAAKAAQATNVRAQIVLDASQSFWPILWGKYRSRARDQSDRWIPWRDGDHSDADAVTPWP
jgi:hypothetical protein